MPNAYGHNQGLNGFYEMDRETLMMMKAVVSLAVLVLASMPAAAQQEKPDNVLTPTDVLEAAQVSLTGGVRIGLGRA